MKKRIKQMLALLLCLTMCFGMASPALAAYYAAGTVVEDDGTDGEIAAGTVVNEDEQPTITLPQDNAVLTTTRGDFLEGFRRKPWLIASSISHKIE